MELKDKKINFLGDSITAGDGTTDSSKRYTALIADMTGASTRNYGIGGTRIARQKAASLDPRHDIDFCIRAGEMIEDADIIAVFGGTNDYGHGDAPIGKMSDRTPATFYGALHTLYRTLVERYPESTIVVLTPLHRLNETDTRDDKPDLKGYVEIIREVAEYYSLPILDLFANSGLQPEVDIIREKYMPDGLHPNDEGHIILANKIVAFLNKL